MWDVCTAYAEWSIAVGLWNWFCTWKNDINGGFSANILHPDKACCDTEWVYVPVTLNILCRVQTIQNISVNGSPPCCHILLFVCFPCSFVLGKKIRKGKNALKY